MKEFEYPMKTREKIAGWIYLPVHMFLMPLFILPFIAIAAVRFGLAIDAVTLNVVYYAAGLVFVLIFMFSFLKKNVTSTWRCWPFKPWLIGFGIFYGGAILVNLILNYMGVGLINPNQEAVNDAVAMDTATMIAVAVIMAPIVEEVLFRGVVFGTIREKNRILAYAVSVILFSVYHLWASAVKAGDPTVLIYLGQYIPAGIVLAWIYERCGSIWASILFHMAANSLSVLVSSALGQIQ